MQINKNNNEEFKDELMRYLSFWPYFILSILICLSCAFVYLRYAEYKFQSKSVIEIIDKAQDSEMALPTAMTIFNRSMINLENEIGVLKSFNLHKRVVKSLKSNIKFYSVGSVKTTENHINEWVNILFNLNIDSESIDNYSSYKILYDGSLLKVISYDENGDFSSEFSLNSNGFKGSDYDLPFDLKIDKNLTDKFEKIISFIPFDDSVDYFKESIQIIPNGKESDQLQIILDYPNTILANEYLSNFIAEFNKDGISDRQLEYQRTINFVNSRSDILLKELEIIENKKQKYKQENKLTDVKSDAEFNIQKLSLYSSDLFRAKSQQDLVVLLESSIDFESFELIPINIGIENESLNQLIISYNLLVRDYKKFKISAGPKNIFVKNLSAEIKSYQNNIKSSIKNFKESLKKTIDNIEKKESELTGLYSIIPEKEKILRAIERELEVKEALFLLLLQKKEEASINFAVVKPSIKIIDNARNSRLPISPNKTFIYALSILAALISPIVILYIRFNINSKIHTRKDLNNLLNKEIPIVAEIPFISNEIDKNSIAKSNSRGIISESMRMLISNLNFVLFDDKNKNNKNNIILVTSSIKGEGKTIVSCNLASILSSENRVLLIGADLRNPQIHKLIGLNKEQKGVSNYIYSKDNDYKNYLIKRNKNFDIFLSGTIPPNPSQLLSSKKFELLLEKTSTEYDYVIIDSAPCLLVADTLNISKYVDACLYIARANYTENKISEYIYEIFKDKKINNMGIVLNGVGNSQSYGYKYGYQYGYKYGYNYGYGYEYLEDK